MPIAEVFSPQNAQIFMLLLARFGSLFVLFPFYSHMQIPVIIKSTFALVLAMYFFPAAAQNTAVEGANILQALFLELLLGFVAALALVMSFAILQMAGEHMSFTMGFSMASVLDPSSGTQTPIIGHAISLMALLLYLLYDGHHLSLELLSRSLAHVPLGEFSLDERWWRVMMRAAADIYLVGLCMAFPIIALSMMSDFAFGLLMKTMPQFNLLVVGYPIKITISFAVLMAILATVLHYFKSIILTTYASLNAILGG